MATDRYGKGSILYKLLIVLLTAALVISIVYPKKLWDQEARNQEICRYRMSNLYNAELQFQRFSSFSANPVEVIQFVKGDPRYLHLVDSLVVQPIKDSVHMIDSLQQIQVLADTLIGTLIAAGVDSAIIDSVDRMEDNVNFGSRRVRELLEAVRERMVNLPSMPIPTLDKGLEIIERKDYFFTMEVVRRMLKEVGNLQVAHSSSKEALTNFENMRTHLNQTIEDMGKVPAALDSLYFCPTFSDSLKIAVVDSGAFRFANIFCPISQGDIQRAQTDFLRSRIGALKIINHGHIVKNEKSWEQQK